LTPIFVLSTKCIDPWVLENRGFKHYRQQSMYFYIRGLSGPRNQRKLETPRLIMIS